MKPTPKDYQSIAIFALTGNEEQVRLMLSKGLDYKFAQLYVEQFHDDNLKASQLINNVGHCECGNVATKFTKDASICGNCSFTKLAKQIEFAPAYQVIGTAEIIPDQVDGVLKDAGLNRQKGWLSQTGAEMSLNDMSW